MRRERRWKHVWSHTSLRNNKEGRWLGGVGCVCACSRETRMLPQLPPELAGNPLSFSYFPSFSLLLGAELKGRGGGRPAMADCVCESVAAANQMNAIIDTYI
jgi:hypothetical protein